MIVLLVALASLSGWLLLSAMLVAALWARFSRPETYTEERRRYLKLKLVKGGKQDDR